MFNKKPNDMKDWAETMVNGNPELANDIYFALDDALVKSPQPWQQLTEIVNNWVNPKPKTYGPLFIEDAEDGSGDGILTFPPEMVEELGWKEGDTLNLAAGENGTITITKV